MAAHDVLDIRLGVPTQRSEEWLARARAVAPSGVQGDGRWAEPFPLFMERAAGSRVWDVDGNEYIDYWASAGPSVLGHNDTRVRAAVTRALEEEAVLFTTPHPREVELAEELVRIIPCAEKVSLCGGGGSDPMYNAVRVARAHTGRKKILKFEGGYHGWHDYYAVSVRPKPDAAGPPNAPTPVPVSAGSLKEATDQVVVAPFHDHDALERIVDSEAENLAAVIIEPVCHSAGCLIIDKEFLELIRAKCSEYGIVLIFDEVITGFRHHIGGAQTLVGVTPDLGVFGKAMANGFPISALVGRNEIMSRFMPEGDVYISGTFMGHLVGVTAALEVISLLRDGTVHSRLWEVGERIASALNELCVDLELDAHCACYGSMWCLYFRGDPVRTFRDIIHMTKYDKQYPKDLALRHHLLNRGIYLQPHYTNRAFTSAAHSDDDVDRTIEAVQEFLRNNQDILRSS